jgi:hypothetical protein
MGRPVRSVIWHYMDSLSATTARCKECRTVIACKNSTGNLWLHLRRHHRHIYDRAMENRRLLEDTGRQHQEQRAARRRWTSSMEAPRSPSPDSSSGESSRSVSPNHHDLTRDTQHAAWPQSQNYRTMPHMRSRWSMMSHDPGKLVDSLILLLAARDCGNRYVTTDIEEIEAILRQIGVIL